MGGGYSTHSRWAVLLAPYENVAGQELKDPVIIIFP